MTTSPFDFDEVEGEMVIRRLREISLQIKGYKEFLDVSPGNQLMIDLLEEERQVLTRQYIRSVK